MPLACRARLQLQQQLEVLHYAGKQSASTVRGVKIPTCLKFKAWTDRTETPVPVTECVLSRFLKGSPSRKILHVLILRISSCVSEGFGIQFSERFRVCGCTGISINSWQPFRPGMIVPRFPCSLLSERNHVASVERHSLPFPRYGNDGAAGCGCLSRVIYATVCQLVLIACD